MPFSPRLLHDHTLAAAYLLNEWFLRFVEDSNDVENEAMSARVMHFTATAVRRATPAEQRMLNELVVHLENAVKLILSGAFVLSRSARTPVNEADRDGVLGEMNRTIATVEVDRDILRHELVRRLERSPNLLSIADDFGGFDEREGLTPKDYAEALLQHGITFETVGGRSIADAFGV